MLRYDLNVPPSLQGAKVQHTKSILKNPPKFGLNTCGRKSLKTLKKEPSAVFTQHFIALSQENPEEPISQ